jgi:hemin uptake protein HemP
MKTILTKILPMDASERKGVPATGEKAFTGIPGGSQHIESDDLFNGQVEIVIRHNGRAYRLRQTRLGKLILTA